MIDADRAGAERYRRRKNAIRIQMVDRERDAHDIDDRIDGAHFVEMHGLHRNAVDFRLGRPDLGEDGEAQLGRAFAEARVLDEPHDVRVSAVMVAVIVRVAVIVTMVMVMVMFMIMMMAMVVMMVVTMAVIMIVVVMTVVMAVRVFMRLLQHFQRPTHRGRVVLEQHVRLERGDALLDDATPRERITAYVELAKLPLDIIPVGAEIDERRQGHVAG